MAWRSHSGVALVAAGWRKSGRTPVVMVSSTTGWTIWTVSTTTLYVMPRATIESSPRMLFKCSRWRKRVKRGRPKVSLERVEVWLLSPTHFLLILMKPQVVSTSIMDRSNLNQCLESWYVVVFSVYMGEDVALQDTMIPKVTIWWRLVRANLCFRRRSPNCCPDVLKEAIEKLFYRFNLD